LKDGVLRRYDQCPCPVCVSAEIMDNWQVIIVM
jgi:RNA polymerase subunit RPABC4/transcription elongation factor Spt4